MIIRKGLILVAILIMASLHQVSGQSPQMVQEFTGFVSTQGELIFYDLFDLQAGDTLYIYVEATSGDLDTLVAIGDIDFANVFDEDDDGGEGLNSLLVYPIVETGDYSIAVTNCCNETSGDYRLLLGINAPDVLAGTAQPTGDEIAVLFGAPLIITDCSTLEERPMLSGPEMILETDRFVIHYTMQGRDGATPSFVESVARILDDVWQVQIVNLGWPTPPKDCGEGGDSRFDIYLMETISDDRTLGFARPEGLVGDNPGTLAEEIYAAYGYLVLDNDFSTVADPQRVMRATMAHEFNHIIQFGYDINEPLVAFSEAAATWMETKTFPESEDATPYVIDLFTFPDICIGSLPEDPLFDTRVYAEWLLLDSMAQDFGNPVVRQLWERIAIFEGMEAFYTLIEELETTPGELVRRFAIRNLLRHYDLAGNFDDRVRVESNINGIGKVVPRRDGVQELSVDYVLVANRDLYTFELAEDDLELLVVGVNQPDNQALVYNLGTRGTVDTRPFDLAYAIILNPNQHDDPSNCSTREWTLSVTDGTGAPLSPADSEIWDSTNFIPAG